MPVHSEVPDEDGPVYVEQRCEVRSLYGWRSKQPLVSIQIGDRKAITMTPGKAAEIAQMLWQAAEGAMSDAFLFEFVREVVGTEEQGAAYMLDKFRRWRREREEELLRTDDESS